jgi:group I intron endonuclease
MGYIYKITNNITNKCYIGVTKLNDPIHRWNRHLQSIARGKGCPALRDAINKYGKDNFRFEVLLICFDDDRFTYEIEYIKKYNSIVPNGYNILHGGICGGGFKGHTHSKETILKIKAKLKEMYTNDDFRYFHSQRIKDGLKDVNIRERMNASAKWQKALQEGRVGWGSNSTHKHTQDSKEKISRSLKEYYATNGGNKVTKEKHRETMTRAVGRRVYQKDADGKIIALYASMPEASRATGIGLSNIKKCVCGKSKTAGSYIWEAM